MSGKNSPIQITLVILSFTGSLISSAGLAENSRDLDLLEYEIAEVVRPLVESGERVGVSIGFIHGEKSGYYSYGEVVEGEMIEPNPSTLYQIASITKTFTTLLLADMVTRGEVGLDDAVSTCLPVNISVPGRPGRNITLLDLATHTSGLPPVPDNLAPADELNPYADYTVEMLYDFLAGYALEVEPGRQYRYSNLGISLLGHALALKAGKSYEDLVVERVCRSLGMEDTRITLAQQQLQNLAQGYWSEWNESLIPPSFFHEAVPPWDTGIFSPAGGLYSNAKDMIAYISANLGLRDTQMSAAFDLVHTLCREAYTSMTICLGWHGMAYEGIEVLMHHGGTFGFNCDVVFSKEDGVGVVILSNSYVYGSESIDEVGLEILQILRKHECMSNYRRLLEEHTILRESFESEYDALNISHDELIANYTKLRSDFDELRAAFEILNSSEGTEMEDLGERLERVVDLLIAFGLSTAASIIICVYVVLKSRT